MNSPLHLPILMTAFTAVSSLAGAQEKPVEGMATGAKAVITERITDDQLRKLQSDEKLRVAAARTATAGPEATVAVPTRSFEESTDFISFNGLCSFVPKGAILHLPD